MDTNSINISIFIEWCSALGLALSDRQVSQFVRYYELLSEKNKVMNLTAITEWDDVVTRHYLDSLLLSRVRELTGESLTVLDMGTGAGFPGIPLKIAFPQHRFTLADSLNKRIRFLEEVIRELELENVQTVHARAEELGHKPSDREQYDLVVSRAVANLSSLCEYCIPFVRTGGQFISYKSIDIDMEYSAAGRAIEVLGGRSKGITTLPLPGTDMERSFVVIDKIRSTPGRYPRKAGMPTKAPL